MQKTHTVLLKPYMWISNGAKQLWIHGNGPDRLWKEEPTTEKQGNEFFSWQIWICNEFALLEEWAVLSVPRDKISLFSSNARVCECVALVIYGCVCLCGCVRVCLYLCVTIVSSLTPKRKHVLLILVVDCCTDVIISLIGNSYSGSECDPLLSWIIN